MFPRTDNVEEDPIVRFARDVFPVTVSVPPMLAFPTIPVFSFTTKFDKNVFPVTYKIP